MSETSPYQHDISNTEALAPYVKRMDAADPELQQKKSNSPIERAQNILSRVKKQLTRNQEPSSNTTENTASAETKVDKDTLLEQLNFNHINNIAELISISIDPKKYMAENKIALYDAQMLPAEVKEMNLKIQAKIDSKIDRIFDDAYSYFEDIYGTNLTEDSNNVDDYILRQLSRYKTNNTPGEAGAQLRTDILIGKNVFSQHPNGLLPLLLKQAGYTFDTTHAPTLSGHDETFSESVETRYISLLRKLQVYLNPILLAA